MQLKFTIANKKSNIHLKYISFEKVSTVMKGYIKSLFIIANLLAVLGFVSFSAIAKDNFWDDEEETVVISIINFGRDNPFEPYVETIEPKETEKQETEKSEEADEEMTVLENVPSPPPLTERMNERMTELLDTKVNGILYDPSSRSVALVNIRGTDYMLHRGDSVNDIIVHDISENAVTLKLDSNTYTVSVGEIIEGDLQVDSVKREGRIFAGSDYNLPNINLEDIN